MRMDERSAIAWELAALRDPRQGPEKTLRFILGDTALHSHCGILIGMPPFDTTHCHSYMEIRSCKTGFDFGFPFDDSRVMESGTAVTALAALAQESRLGVYRLLVRAGPEGMAASEIAERLGIPANTLSFHLKTLSHADLVQSRQAGRFIYYTTNYEQMNSLLGFLTENCCGGRSCAPQTEAGRKRKPA